MDRPETDKIGYAQKDEIALKLHELIGRNNDCLKMARDILKTIQQQSRGEK